MTTNVSSRRTASSVGMATLTAVGILFLLIFTCTFLVSCGGGGTSAPTTSPSPAPALPPPTITWSASSVEPILSPGESTSQDMTFRSDRSFQNAVVEVIGDVATFVTISPSSFASVPANQDQTISLSFSVPQGTVLGTLNGTIQVRSGGQTLSQGLTVNLEVVPHKLTGTVTLGIDGGSISLPFGIVLSLPVGALSRDVQFEINLYSRSSLPSSIPDAAIIYSNVEIVPKPVDPTGGPPATATFLATITSPLRNVILPAASELVVLEPNLSGHNWAPTGDIAVVGADGKTATFQTRKIGLLVLVRQAERGLEITP